MDEANKPVSPDFRKPILGALPDEKFHVPLDSSFVRYPDENDERPIPESLVEIKSGLKTGQLVELEFLPAPSMEAIAHALIEARTCFEDIRRAKIRYLWKKKGGRSAKRLTLGKCIKVSGLLKYVTGLDFIIWFGADNCRYLGLTNWAAEALTFHELKHADIDIDEDTGEADPFTVGHDWEGFVDELSHYGPWHPTIKKLQTALHPTAAEQPSLFDQASANAPDQDQPAEAMELYRGPRRSRPRLIDIAPTPPQLNPAPNLLEAPDEPPAA